jgi:4'-phosphopantetheinyl transferase EntD
VIAAILPEAVAVAESREDGPAEFRYPEEEALAARAVEKRRRELAGGRECAHRALATLGVEPGPILAGPKGEPLWPAGTVGAITHTGGYRAAVVARAEDLAALAIDAEENAPLPAAVLSDVARPEERARLAELARTEPGVHWDRLLFSAKESVYKAWFPLTGRWLGFEDASLELDPAARRFRARLLVPGPSLDGTEVRGFEGRWLVADGLLLTAIALLR